MLRINNVKVALGRKDYAKIVSMNIHVNEKSIQNIRLVKQSVDARRQPVSFICSFEFEHNCEEQLLKKSPQLQRAIPYQYEYKAANDKKVVVIGSGPAGLFCAYVLAQVGQNVCVIERGQNVEQRVKDVDALINHGILNPQSNIAFGEGGAGTFSDGKLTTGIKNKRLKYILETFVKHGAPEDILYEAKPHIGTDYLRRVLITMRKEMEAKGVTFLFNTQFINFEIKDEQKHIHVSHQGKQQTLIADDLVLAIGHSARDTYEMLYHKGLTMEPKGFAVGVRIEQSQKKINDIQHGKAASSPHLKAASYKLTTTTKDKRGVYTFCMCPGGFVVPSMNEEGTLCINGMSYYARQGENANSAILVNVNPEDYGSDHPLNGIAFQRQLEEKAYALGGHSYHAPVQLVKDYLENKPTLQLGKIKPSYQMGFQLCNLHSLFPDFINRNLKAGLQLMNQKMPGFIDDDTLIVGVESRSSAPVRLLRDASYQSCFPGIYPIGEGAGYAGGIMSAAVDGIICAEMILKEDSDGSSQNT